MVIAKYFLDWILSQKWSLWRPRAAVWLDLEKSCLFVVLIFLLFCLFVCVCVGLVWFGVFFFKWAYPAYCGHRDNKSYGGGDVGGKVPFFQPVLSRTKPLALFHNVSNEGMEIGQKANPKILIADLFLISKYMWSF